DDRGRAGVTSILRGQALASTYAALETRHVRIKMPWAIMWGRGVDDRPETVTVEPLAGMRWQIATQLHPGSTPYEFTAPNLQYLMDSPVEFGPIAMRQFLVGSRTFRFSLHHTGTDAELDACVTDVERIVREEGAL